MSLFKPRLPSRPPPALRRPQRAVRVLSLLCAVTLGVLGWAAPGASHVVDVTIASTTTDPNDTAGRLDIAEVSDRLRVSSHRVRVHYQVRTYSGIRADTLRPDERNFVLELNRDGQAGSERNISIAFSRGTLVARVISNATREVVGLAAVAQPDDTVIHVSGSRQLIGARSYFWTSNFHAVSSPRCGEDGGFPVTCQDSVPDRGWLRLDRPAWPRVS